MYVNVGPNVNEFPKFTNEKSEFLTTDQSEAWKMGFSINLVLDTLWERKYCTVEFIKNAKLEGDFVATFGVCCLILDPVQV